MCKFWTTVFWMGNFYSFLPLANLSPIVKLAQELYRPVFPGVLDFGRAVNPISTRRGRFCPPHYHWHPLIVRPTYCPVLMIDGNMLKKLPDDDFAWYRGSNIFFFHFFFYKCGAALKAGHRGVGLQLHIAEKILLGHS